MIIKVYFLFSSMSFIVVKVILSPLNYCDFIINQFCILCMVLFLDLFYSVLLISLLIFMAVPCYIDYCNFTILVSDSVGLSVFLVFHRFVLGVCHFIWILELACQFVSKVHHFYFADFISFTPSYLIFSWFCYYK